MIYNFGRNKKNNEMKRPSLTSDNITPLKGAFDKFPDMKGTFVKSTINKNQKTIKEFFLERIGNPRFEQTSSNSEDKKYKNDINNKKQNKKFLDFKINFGSTIYYDLRDYQSNNNENSNKIEFNKKLLQKSNNFNLTRSKIPISTFFYDRNKKIKQNLNISENNFKNKEKLTKNKIEPKNENNEKISFINKEDYFNKHIINQKLKINKNLNNNNNNNSFTNTKNTLFVNYKKFKPLKIFNFSSNSKQDFSTLNSQENINNFNTIANSTTGNSFYSKDNLIIQNLNKTENNFYNKKNIFNDNSTNISIENSKTLKNFEKKFNKKLKILNKKQNNMNKKLFRIINRSQVKRKEKPLDKVLEVILDKKMKKQKKKNDIKDLYIKASNDKEVYKIMNSEKAGILQMGDLITKISDEQALKLSERIIENYNIKEEKLEIGKINTPEFIKKKLIKEAEISRKNMINNNRKLEKMRINIITKKDNLFKKYKRVLSPIPERKIFVLNDDFKDEDLYDKIYF